MTGLPLELACSWPAAERDARLAFPHASTSLPLRMGRWSCLIGDSRLTWEPRVFELFGLDPARGVPRREDALACYEEDSRAAMERLRAHAIRHRRGFTIDVRIRPADGALPRWIRLSAVAVPEPGRPVVRIEGIKTDVTALYVAG